jgi:sugar/nucleoside kinase (ribokinase family)
MSELGVRDLDREYLRSGRHFHLSSLFLQKGLQPGLVELFAELKAAGLTLSLDTNDDPDDRWQSGLPELLGLVDVFLPNDDEACRMTQTESVEQAADALAAMVPLVAIKCGSRGALVRSGEESWMVPPFCVEPVDAIGAGDSFNAGFLKAYLQGQHPAACALEGNRVAALSTTERGGTTAFRDREQMTAALRAAKLRTQTVEAVETAS